MKNEYSLLTFILVWHYVSMNFKILEINRLKKYELYKQAIGAIVVFFSVFTILDMIIVPILARFNVPLVMMDTDYWGTRYSYMFFYIVLNILICAMPLFNNFMFFISDGIILS